MPIRHRLQIVMDRASRRRYCDRLLGLARNPFLSARQKVEPVADRVEGRDLTRERAGLVRRRAARRADQRGEFLGVALFVIARRNKKAPQPFLLDVPHELLERDDPGALGFEQQVQPLFETLVHGGEFSGPAALAQADSPSKPESAGPIGTMVRISAAQPANLASVADEAAKRMEQAEASRADRERTGARANDRGQDHSDHHPGCGGAGPQFAHRERGDYRPGGKDPETLMQPMDSMEDLTLPVRQHTE